MASPTYVPMEVIPGQLDEMTNFIQKELERGYISNKMGELINQPLQIVKKSEVQSAVDRNMLKSLLACAKRQVSERHGDASQNACNCTLCNSVFEDDTPILTPASSNGSASSVDSQTDEAIYADGICRDQLLSFNGPESQSDGKSTLRRDWNELQARILAGTNASPPKTADATTSNNKSGKVNAKTAGNGIRNKVSAATQQAALDMFGVDIKQRLAKTASIYLFLELLVTMPVAVSTPARLACMMFTFAIITWKRVRELVRLKESMLPGKEELWTRQEITMLKTWILAMVGLGLMVYGQNVPYYER